MRLRFITVVSILIIYTFYKVIQLWPSDALGSVILSVAIFTVMLGGMIIYRAKASVFDKWWFKALSWAGSLSMALWMTYIIVSIPFDLFDWMIIGISEASEVSAQKFYPYIHDVFTFVFIFSIGLVGFGFLQVLRGPKVKKVLVPISTLPDALRGLKIAQISDLHVGVTIRKNYVQEVARLTNSTAPDLIVLTGDIVDGHLSSIVEHLKPLGELKSKYGVFFVTGNHEYYWGDAKAMLSMMEDLNMKFLFNENSIIKIGNDKMMIAGITDTAGTYMLSGHAPDMTKAAATTEDVSLKILLSHRPDMSETEKHGFDLQLSGHTHAGQFFPFSLFIGFFHKYSRGLYKQNNTWIYVNPGTGYWGPADRLGVIAEVSLLTLT